MPKNSSILDLFKLVKGEVKFNPQLADDLYNLANQTLFNLDPEYQVKACKMVLDELENSKKFTSHDLAVLCYEAISYIENRIGR